MNLSPWQGLLPELQESVTLAGSKGRVGSGSPTAERPGRYTPAQRTLLVLLAAVALLIGLATYRWVLAAPTLVPVAAPVPPSTPGVAVSDPTTAAAQSALDQIYGPGHSVVRVATATSGTSDSYIGRQVSGPRALTGYASTRQSFGSTGGAGGTSTSTSTSYDNSQSLVSGYRPAGAVVRMTVAVSIDSSLRPTPNLAAVGSLVANAVGLDRRRGDAISVAAVRFAPRTLVSADPAAPPTPLGKLQPLVEPGAAALVLLAALAAFARTATRRRAV
jgi:flagellar biosynthesis/type III secretory pathway M-ring protein FliF/YscJ